MHPILLVRQGAEKRQTELKTTYTFQTYRNLHNKYYYLVNVKVSCKDDFSLNILTSLYFNSQ